MTGQPCPSPEIAGPASPRCCKCEAYREIIAENAAQIALMRKEVAEIMKYSKWLAEHMENLLKIKS